MSNTFSKELTLNNRSSVFQFRKIPASYPSYQVEVADEKGGKVTFSMIRPAGGSWRAVSNRLPLWIGEAESVLAEAIEEQEVSA